MDTFRLAHARIAILAGDGFEQSELTEPKRLLEADGAQVDVISPVDGEITGWKDKNWGDKVKVDVPLGQAQVEDYAALVLPGGVINPDTLRLDQNAVALIVKFADAGKLIAAICHGPQLLIEARLVDGKKLTSWPSLKTDLENAGAQWQDSGVVVDGQLITSRKPQDIGVFVRAIEQALCQ